MPIHPNMWRYFLEITAILSADVAGYSLMAENETATVETLET